MDMPQNTAELLMARKHRVAADIMKHKQAIERHTTAVDGLLAEMKDIEIAERVLLNIGVITDRGTGSEVDIDDVPAVQKPEGTPSMPDMIKEALTVAHRQGSPSLEPIGLLPYIQDRWWPQAQTTSVGPIAWRMWKRGELVKDGPRYALPNAEQFYPRDREANELFD